MKVTFVIDERGAFHAQKTIGDLPTDGSMMVTIQKVTRTLAHNAVQWRIAQGLDGGMVMLGHKTREFKKDEWPDWMAFLESVAADRGVKVPMSKRQYESMGYE